MVALTALTVVGLAWYTYFTALTLRHLRDQADRDLNARERNRSAVGLYLAGICRAIAKNFDSPAAGFDVQARLLKDSSILAFDQLLAMPDSLPDELILPAMEIRDEVSLIRVQSEHVDGLRAKLLSTALSEHRPQLETQIKSLTEELQRSCESLRQRCHEFGAYGTALFPESGSSSPLG